MHNDIPSLDGCEALDDFIISVFTKRSSLETVIQNHVRYTHMVSLVNKLGGGEVGGSIGTERRRLRLPLGSTKHGNRGLGRTVSLHARTN